MEFLTQFGVPVVAIIVAGALVWATTQVCKKAIRDGREKYLLYSGAGAVVAACLVVLTMGPWSWLTYAWVSYGGWIAANLGHKAYAATLKKVFKKYA